MSIHNIYFLRKKENIYSTLVISNFTGPDEKVRVTSSLRQPNHDIIGMMTPCRNVLGIHMNMVIQIIYAYFSLFGSCLFQDGQ